MNSYIIFHTYGFNRVLIRKKIEYSYIQKWQQLLIMLIAIVKFACNNYKFPLYDFTHETLIKDVRAKLLEGINKKLSEDFTNVLKNKDFESGMKRLDELRNELNMLM